MDIRTQWGVQYPDREARGWGPLWDSSWTEADSSAFVRANPAARVLKRTVTYSEWEEVHADAG